VASLIDNSHSPLADFLQQLIVPESSEPIATGVLRKAQKPVFQLLIFLFLIEPKRVVDPGWPGTSAV
jgi:hypothetical protein